MFSTSHNALYPYIQLKMDVMTLSYIYGLFKDSKAWKQAWVGWG